MAWLGRRCRVPARPEADADTGTDSGFSLVEVIVAMAIFLLVSAATLGLILTSIKTVRGNADRVYAAALARGEVDYLRTLGSASIPLGASTRTVTAAGGNYTVTSTATWVNTGATTNPCSVGPGVVPGKSYLRIHVDVVGQTLGAPQSVDAIVLPSETSPTQNTGTITVAVAGKDGAAVEGVAVVVASSGGTYTYTQTTGPDGCVFFPDLPSGTGWSATITKSGYITQTPGANSQSGLVVTTLQNTPVSFTFAQSGSVTFTAGSSGFPVPTGMPFAFAPNTWNKTADASGGYPVTITGLWPDNYTGWLRPCSASTGGSTGSATLAPGGAASLALGGTRVQVVGPSGTTITASPASPCTNTYALGTWNATLLKQATLPAGTWTLTAAGQTPATKKVILSDALGQCSVSWSVPGAVTRKQADALLADPAFVPPPGGLIVLPEVSDPCPTAP